MGIFPGIIESPPILMYLQACLDLFPLPVSLNIPSLLHPNSYFGYIISWLPPNLNIWICKADQEPSIVRLAIPLLVLIPRLRQMLLVGCERVAPSECIVSEQRALLLSVK